MSVWACMAKRHASVIVVLLVLLIPLCAQAHEPRPSIAEVSLGSQKIFIDLRISLESLMAGSLTSHAGEMDPGASSQFAALSRLSAKALQSVLEQEIENLLPLLTIQDQAGNSLVVDYVSVVIPETVVLGALRDSHLRLAVTVDANVKTTHWRFGEQFGAVVLRSESGETDSVNLIKSPFAILLKPGERSGPMALRADQAEIVTHSFFDYIVIGFQHILPKGLDHILFVAALFFLSPRAKTVFAQISVFTLAHTITLALGATNLIAAPTGIVEPLIAFSIVVVGLENLFRRQVSKARLCLIFCFGLLHGLGFASVLNELAVADEQIYSSLFAFNIGVEIGQISVLLCCFALLGWWQRYHVWYRKLVSIPASLAISMIGLVWFFQRL